VGARTGHRTGQADTECAIFVINLARTAVQLDRAPVVDEGDTVNQVQDGEQVQWVSDCEGVESTMINAIPWQ